MDIQQDKIDMKAIEVAKHFKNFAMGQFENYVVKTDIKRLQ